MPFGNLMLLKIAGAVFGILFLVNWVCLLSSQKINGFRWGDFVLALFVVAVLFVNLPRLRSMAALVPDTLQVFNMETKAKLENFNTGVRDTRQTVTQISGYLQDVAEREMEYQMQLNVPPHAEP